MKDNDSLQMPVQHHKLSHFVIKHIPIEQKKRSRAKQLLIFINYAVDYIILWLLVSISLVSATNLAPFVWPFLAARAAMAIAFIVVQHPALLLMNKISIIAQLILTNSESVAGEFGTILAEVLMAGVWALTKQQRMLHFDSKLGLSASFGKQAAIYASILAHAVLNEQINIYDRQFTFLSIFLAIGILDNSELYYIKRTKQMFLRLDMTLAVLLVIATIKDALDISYTEFLFASFLLMSISAIHLIFTPKEGERILTFSTKNLQKMREDELWEYVVQLKRSLSGKNVEAIQTYIFKLKEESQDEQLLERINFCQDKDISFKKELINNQIFIILRYAAKHISILRDLGLFLHAPSPRFATFLDLSCWHHRRQYHRIITEEITDLAMQQAEVHKQLATVRDIVSQYSQVGDSFYQQLMKERISEGKTMQLGSNLMILIEKLKKICLSHKKPSPEVTDLINQFCEACLPVRYQGMLVQKSQLDKLVSVGNQAQIMISDENNKLTVLSVNLCFIKLTYLRRQKCKGKDISTILPQPFTDYLNKILNKRISNDENQRCLPKHTIYLFNKLGYMNICEMLLHFSSHRGSREWKIVLKELYTGKSIIAFNAYGELVGCSELCNHFGFTPELAGNGIERYIFSQFQSSQLIYIEAEDKFFSKHEFSLTKNIVLHPVERFKLPQTNSEIYLFEVKQYNNYVKQDFNRIPFEPGPFQFHFHWSGKISTEVQPFAILSNRQQSARKNINYGQNITEMRYYAGRIDYKSNFQEERDCPSLQPHLEQALSNLTQSQYYERWEQKKEQTPNWFKASTCIIVVLAIIAISSFVFLYLQFNTAKSSSSTNLQIICKLGEKLQSAIRLATLTTAPRLNLNATQLINEQVSFTNLISNKIFILNQNIFSQFGGQIILDQLNSLNLIINSYLLDSKYPPSNALTLITTRLQPSYQAFYDQYIAQIFSNVSSIDSLNMVVLLVSSITCFALILILACLQWKIYKKKGEIVEILKFIDNDCLTTYRKRLAEFKQRWLENGEIKEEDEQQVEEERKTNSPKHLIKQIRVGYSKYYYLSWLAVTIALLMLHYNHISGFNNLSNNFITFNSHITKHNSILQTIWAEYNNPTPNITLIKRLMSSSLEEEYGKLTSLWAMSGSMQLSLTYLDFYHSFWQNIDYCKYISDPYCQTFIGNAAQEGGSMIVNYLNRQYDSLLNNNLTLYNISESFSVGKINLFYLNQFSKTNNQAQIDEFSFQVNKSSSRIWLIFAASLLSSVFILALICHYRRERAHLLHLQELLMIMPFDRLKTIPCFHRFYLTHYASY